MFILLFPISKKGKINRVGISIYEESDLENMRDGFFKNGIELAINERDVNRLRTFLNLEMNNINSDKVLSEILDSHTVPESK